MIYLRNRASINDRVQVIALIVRVATGSALVLSLLAACSSDSELPISLTVRVATYESELLPGVSGDAPLNGIVKVEDGCLLIGEAGKIGGILPAFPEGKAYFDDETNSLRLKRIFDWKTYPVGSYIEFTGMGYKPEGADLHGCEAPKSVFAVQGFW